MKWSTILTQLFVFTVANLAFGEEKAAKKTLTVDDFYFLVIEGQIGTEANPTDVVAFGIVIDTAQPQAGDGIDYQPRSYFIYADDQNLKRDDSAGFTLSFNDNTEAVDLEPSDKNMINAWLEKTFADIDSSKYKALFQKTWEKVLNISKNDNNNLVPIKNLIENITKKEPNDIQVKKQSWNFITKDISTFQKHIHLYTDLIQFYEEEYTKKIQSTLTKLQNDKGIDSSITSFPPRVDNFFKNPDSLLDTIFKVNKVNFKDLKTKLKKKGYHESADSILVDINKTNDFETTLENIVNKLPDKNQKTGLQYYRWEILLSVLIALTGTTIYIVTILTKLLRNKHSEEAGTSPDNTTNFSEAADLFSNLTSNFSQKIEHKEESEKQIDTLTTFKSLCTEEKRLKKELESSFLEYSKNPIENSQLLPKECQHHILQLKNGNKDGKSTNEELLPFLTRHLPHNLKQLYYKHIPQKMVYLQSIQIQNFLTAKLANFNQKPIQDEHAMREVLIAIQGLKHFENIQSDNPQKAAEVVRAEMPHLKADLQTLTDLQTALSNLTDKNAPDERLDDLKRFKQQLNRYFGPSSLAENLTRCNTFLRELHELQAQLPESAPQPAVQPSLINDEDARFPQLPKQLHDVLAQYQQLRQNKARLQPYLEALNSDQLADLAQVLADMSQLFSTSNIRTIQQACQHLCDEMANATNNQNARDPQTLWHAIKAQLNSANHTANEYRSWQELHQSYGIKEDKDLKKHYQAYQHLKSLQKHLAGNFRTSRELTDYLSKGFQDCSALAAKLDPQSPLQSAFRFEKFLQTLEKDRLSHQSISGKMVELEKANQTLADKLQDSQQIHHEMVTNLGLDPRSALQDAAMLTEQIDACYAVVAGPANDLSRMDKLMRQKSTLGHLKNDLAAFHKGSTETTLVVACEEALRFGHKMQSVSKMLIHDCGFRHTDLADIPAVEQVTNRWQLEKEERLHPLRLILAGALASCRLATNELLVTTHYQRLAETLDLQEISDTLAKHMEQLEDTQPDKVWNAVISNGFASGGFNKLMRAYVLLDTYYKNDANVAYLLQSMAVSSQAILTIAAKAGVQFVRINLLQDAPNGDLAQSIGPADAALCEVDRVRQMVNDHLAEGQTGFVVDVPKWPAYVGGKLSKGKIAIVHPGQWRGGASS